MTAISLDPKVMEFFPTTRTPEQTKGFVKKMQEMFDDKGYCYFAVDVLEPGKFIGFIGLCYQTYNVPFAPFVDVGYRLAVEAWGKGLATEGAARCLNYGFNELGIHTIKAIAVEQNTKSTHVMEKIGMKKALHFTHPELSDWPEYENCVCYSISQTT